MRTWLKELREKLGLTQAQISKKLDISESYYNLIENGGRQKDLDLSIASKLSKILDVTVEWIADQESKSA